MAGYLILSAVAPNTMHEVTMAKNPWNRKNCSVGMFPLPSSIDRPLPKM